MLTEYKRSEEKELVEYELVFDDGANNGYAFPCDKDGNLNEDMHPAAIENYNWCMSHMDQFARANKVIKISRRYREPSQGKCSCGEIVYLTNDYMGACQCPGCGQWYNLFGQELLPPEMWEE